jgi:excisionase family DNA binding protein
MSNDSANKKYLLSVTEASKRYGIGKNKLYEMIKSESDILVTRIGKVCKINAPLFEEWLNNITKDGRCL